MALPKGDIKTSLELIRELLHPGLPLDEDQQQLLTGHVKFLKEQGALNERREHFGPPLCHANQPQLFTIAAQLMDMGADPNASYIDGSQTTTPFIEAVKSLAGNINWMYLYLEHGADVNKKDGSGLSATDHAAIEGQMAVLEIFKKKGGIISAQAGLAFLKRQIDLPTYREPEPNDKFAIRKGTRANSFVITVRKQTIMKEEAEEMIARDLSDHPAGWQIAESGEIPLSGKITSGEWKHMFRPETPSEHKDRVTGLEAMLKKLFASDIASISHNNQGEILVACCPHQGVLKNYLEEGAKWAESRQH